MRNYNLTAAEVRQVQNAASAAACCLGKERGVIAAVEQVLAARFPDAPPQSVRLDEQDRETLLEATSRWAHTGAPEDLFPVVSEIITSKGSSLRDRDR